jgi:hypothetical protein
MLNCVEIVLVLVLVFMRFIQSVLYGIVSCVCDLPRSTDLEILLILTVKCDTMSWRHAPVNTRIDVSVATSPSTSGLYSKFGLVNLYFICTKSCTVLVGVHPLFGSHVPLRSILSHTCTEDDRSNLFSFWHLIRCILE